MSNRPKTAWLFDIDGVLTDPELKIIKRPEILVEIARRLEFGEPVGGNTGRSLRFAEARFLDPLVLHLKSSAFLNRLAIVGDKGGALLTHGRDGRRIRRVDCTLTRAEIRGLHADASRIVREAGQGLVFVDESKQTMVTIEMNDGVNIADFQGVQEEIVERLRDAVRARDLSSSVRVDATRIAIDVESIEAGKALGARRFVDFLRQRHLEPDRYVTFGDSLSDYDMAEELHRNGFAVEFVFVGGRDALVGRDTGEFPVVYTSGHCDDGTVEYLTQGTTG